MDTSILCVWLKVNGMENCGPDTDRWDFERVDKKIKEELSQYTTFVLPLASIIETGNHVAQCNGDRYKLANDFAEIIRKTANEESPWAAFVAQLDLWSKANLNELANNWPPLATSKLSLGDATIKDVAEYYHQSSCEVEIFTGDKGLKSYEPVVITSPPRRRKR